jgi:hypothetical protein
MRFENYSEYYFCLSVCKSVTLQTVGYYAVSLTMFLEVNV